VALIFFIGLEIYLALAEFILSEKR